jgi:hypothetical protein
VRTFEGDRSGCCVAELGNSRGWFEGERFHEDRRVNCRVLENYLNNFADNKNIWKVLYDSEGSKQEPCKCPIVSRILSKILCSKTPQIYCSESPQMCSRTPHFLCFKTDNFKVLNDFRCSDPLEMTQFPSNPSSLLWRINNLLSSVLIKQTHTWLIFCSHEFNSVTEN